MCCEAMKWGFVNEETDRNQQLKQIQLEIIKHAIFNKPYKNVSK